MNGLRTEIARRLRPLYLDWLARRASAAAPRETYAQDGEDRLVASLIGKVDPQEEIYVDIGANHPTRISNTYLFYRQGHSGLVVEPNRSFESLYHKYRPRDTLLQIGCGEQAGLAPFYHNDGSVFSGFGDRSMKTARSSQYLPVLPTDALLPLLGSKRVFLLSIDVEGWNLAVLKSASRLLEVTTCLLIEGEDEEADITAYLQTRNFQLTGRTVYNLVFQRTDPGKADARGATAA